MINRRQLLVASAASLMTAGLAPGKVRAGSSSATAPADETDSPRASAQRNNGESYTPVTTPNGRTLPYRMRDGVKEFHLIAEEIEHEFAPGTRIKAWGYNGSTPGPTIEAQEGDRVRFYVTNRLPEPTTVHWHGLILPNGMDGIAGLTQPSIQPGETFVYEYTLTSNGTYMYHPHADEMVQMAMGLMGMFIVHPRDEEIEAVDRDYVILLHNWAVHPGSYRPDPTIMQDFDLWTMNSKVFPHIDSLVAKTGERVRIRIGNLSMWNHPMHIHGVEFHVTGSEGGRWPRSQWRREVTEIIGVGQTRDLEFIAVPGDWGFHCHMVHHTMNAMGHGLPNTMGVNQQDLAERINQLVPGYMPMGEHGMAEHQSHVDAGHMQGPENTLPMMTGQGPYGNMEMGGMFALIKVRDEDPGDDPGWYQAPEGTVARRVDSVPDDIPT